MKKIIELIDKGIAELQTTASTYKWMVEERDKEIAGLKAKLADHVDLVEDIEKLNREQADRIDALNQELNDQDQHIDKLEKRIQELEGATPPAAAPAPIDPDEKKYLETVQEAINADE